MPQKRLHRSDKNEKWLKHYQSLLHKENPHCKQAFLLFRCISCTATPEILSSSKNINNATCVSRLFSFLMTMEKINGRNNRSSHQRCSIKKGFLKKFLKP